MTLIDAPIRNLVSKPVRPELPDGYVRLPNADWKLYRQLSDRYVDSGILMNYSKGILEIMTLSYRHDRRKMFWDRLILALGDAADFDVLAIGLTTLMSDAVEKGLEPDQAYYIQNATRMLDREELDLSVDPPPDLVVEIDITHVAVDRAEIYAALGVPEMWVFDGKALQAWKLTRGKWKPTKKSLAFPFLTVTDLNQFLKLAGKMSDNQLIKRVRQWAEQQI